MTVFPLYCMIWHDLPTSFPPPKHRNINSSEGSTGSSSTVEAMAEALRFEAMITKVPVTFENWSQTRVANEAGIQLGSRHFKTVASYETCKGSANTSRMCNVPDQSTTVDRKMMMEER